MEYIKLNIRTILLAMTMLFSLACTEDFEELNTDPALLSEGQLDVGLLLTTVQKRMIIDRGADPMGTIGHFSGYISSGGSVPFNEAAFGGDFIAGYSALLNASEIERLTSDDPELINKNAIARIMKVYIYQFITDQYGDIPYSEAVGSLGSVNTQPSYDTQESIYSDLFIELENATSDLDESMSTYGSEDLIYGGDVDKWRRFGNSLKLRMALRLSYSDPAVASSQITSLLSEDLMETNADNAFVTSSDDFESNQNSMYNQIVGWGGKEGLPYYMGNTIVDLLQDNGDPRLPIVIDATINSQEEAALNDDPGLLVYRGRPLGLGTPEEREHYQPGDLSLVGEWYSQPILDIPAIHYSEVCLALAEAKLRFDLGSNSADFWYKEGIRADMERYGISETEIIDFLATPAATLAGTFEEQLQQIMEQKNIALFPNDVEAWSEWRRTGYPKILIGSMVGDTDGQIPRRATYPIEEGNLNSANYKATSDRIGGDVLMTKNWWDANPNVPYEHTGDIFDDFGNE
ncbi:MAG: SusD/RagB family nutrient-binding outer membrane lipoprotein [Cyclobacteriaceae bacterium]